MSSGERPIGAAKGKQSTSEAVCQPPPPPPVLEHHPEVLIVTLTQPLWHPPCALHLGAPEGAQISGTFCSAV